MTPEEYHYLYYGYAFQPSYKPLENNAAMTRVQNIMARLQIDTPSVSDIDELIAAGIAAMEHDPFSPTLLNILAYAYGTSGDKRRERAYATHLEGVLRCIEQSGMELVAIHTDLNATAATLSDGEEKWYFVCRKKQK